jgi:hypothetical protein
VPRSAAYTVPSIPSGHILIKRTLKGIAANAWVSD